MRADLDILKGLAGRVEHGRLGAPPAHRHVDEFRLQFMAGARRPVFSAAMMVLPDPQNGSGRCPCAGHIVDRVRDQQHWLCAALMLAVYTPKRSKGGCRPLTDC